MRLDPAAPAGRTLLMGIVNVTPDSFSDGGLWLGEEPAFRHGFDLVADGADILDIGGESTRPGANRPPITQEINRAVPVIRRLVGAIGEVPISVDTMRAPVAAAAIEAGARIVNDVSGGLADPAMAPLVADAGVDYIAMHWRGHSDTMQSLAVYDDVVADVREELARRVDALVAAGIAPERIVLDPGLGFAKTAEHNWRLLAHLDALQSLGMRLLIGASRKSFLGLLEAAADGTPAPPREREAATAAISAICAHAGVWCVRVHDVAGSRSAVRVGEAMRSHAGSPGSEAS